MRGVGSPASSAILSSCGVENVVFQRVERGQKKNRPGFGVRLSESTNSIIPLLAPCCSFDSRRKNSDGTIIRVYLYPSVPRVKHSLRMRIQEVYYITNYDR